MIRNNGGRGVGDPLGGPGRGQRCPRTLPTAAPPPAPDLLLVPSSTPSRVPCARPDTWPSLKMRAAGPRRAAGCPGVFRLRSKTRRVVSLSLARASYIAPAAASLRGPAWPRRRPCGNPGCCGSGWQAVDTDEQKPPSSLKESRPQAPLCCRPAGRRAREPERADTQAREPLGAADTSPPGCPLFNE